MEISQNFVAFSEYMNFTYSPLPLPITSALDFWHYLVWNLSLTNWNYFLLIFQTRECQYIGGLSSGGLRLHRNQLYARTRKRSQSSWRNSYAHALDWATGHSAMEWMISFDRFKCNWSSDLRLKRKFETYESKKRLKTKIIEINVSETFQIVSTIVVHAIATAVFSLMSRT